jgi:CheY-like chemotaxis protein
MTNGFGCPTILIAEWDSQLRATLVGTLEEQDYLVLVAEDSAEALYIARTHSRPIQLMLTDGSSEGRTLAATLQQYRPQMRVLFTPDLRIDSVLNWPASELTLTKVREFLQPPRVRAAHA